MAGSLGLGHRLEEIGCYLQPGKDWSGSEALVIRSLDVIHPCKEFGSQIAGMS